MKEKLEAGEIHVESKTLRLLDNFWYHYKWHTLIALFFAVVLIVCLAQCSSVEETDVTVTFGGNLILSEAEYDGLKKILGDVCPEDLDGNGEKSVAFKSLSIFNEEQLTEQFTYYYEEYGEERLDRDGMNLYRSTNVENHQNMQTYVMTGDCAVWLVSSYVYSEMFEGKVQVVATAKLTDTAVYRSFDAVKVFPEDTVVVLMRPIMGTYAEEKHFLEAQAYYQSLVGMP